MPEPEKPDPLRVKSPSQAAFDAMFERLREQSQIPLPGAVTIPSFTITPPDHGAAIKDFNAYLDMAAQQGKGVYIILDKHDSYPTQEAINAVLKRLKPRAAAIEHGAADLPMTLDTAEKVLDNIRAKVDADGKADAGFYALLDVAKEQFRLLQKMETRTVFVDNRTLKEQARIADIDDENKFLTQMEVRGEMNSLGARLMRALNRKESDDISAKMDRHAAREIKTLYDQSEGIVAAVVGRWHVEKPLDINEYLIEMGVPREQVHIINMVPVQELPPKQAQLGGIGGAEATFYVKDTALGQTMAQVGDVIASVRLLDASDLRKEVTKLVFTEHKMGNTPRYTSMKVVMDDGQSPPLHADLGIVAFPFAEHPAVKTIKLEYGLPDQEKIIVDVDVRALPMPLPGGAFAEEDKAQWLNALQGGMQELRGKVEAQHKEKTKEPVVEIPETTLPATQPLPFRTAPSKQLPAPGRR